MEEENGSAHDGGLSPVISQVRLSTHRPDTPEVEGEGSDTGTERSFSSRSEHRSRSRLERRGSSLRSGRRSRSRSERRSHPRLERQSCSRLEQGSGSRLEQRPGSRLEPRSGSRLEQRSGSRLEPRSGSGLEQRSGSRLEYGTGSGLEHGVGSRLEQQYEQQQNSEGIQYNRGRSRPTKRMLSSPDSERVSPPRKYIRWSQESDDANAMLDKVLSIIDKVRSSDKPKLSFDTNVLPAFDPMSKEQTILTWLTKVEECAEIYKWDERETIHYSLPKLSGLAKTWYQGLPSVLLSWEEWKRKLIESFPSREDYAELLAEMLAKRVKYGDSLEHYYYAKVNLLNRCQISGRQAVDCILNGVEDRSIKVGAQAAQFKAPEQVLNYFKTVKVARPRDHKDQSDMRRKEDRKSSDNKQTHEGSTNIQCYNCSETGHPSFKCEKPLIKCGNCGRPGHQTQYCRHTNLSNNSSSEILNKPETQVNDKAIK